jgi:hypothetical protein
LRELNEEIGTTAELLGESRGCSDTTCRLACVVGRAIAVSSRNGSPWFTGTDRDIDLPTEHPEFDA